MNCPSLDDWSLFSMGLLDDRQRTAMQQHADACDACGADRESALALDAELRLLHCDRAVDHDRLRDKLVEQLPAVRGATADGQRPRMLPNSKGRRIMRLLSKHPIGAAGIAAALLLAAGVGFFWSAGSVAWADVARRIERVASVSVRQTTYEIGADGEKLCNTRQSFASELYGQREDTYGADGNLFMTEYMLPRRGEWLTIVHGQPGEAGHFERTAMSDADRRRMSAFTPASWAASLLNLGEADNARTLDPEVLDGRETAVFESGRLTIWVDVVSRLPVRLESRGAYLEIYDDFRWDEPLPARLFEPEIPEGYVDKSPPDPVTSPQSWLARAVDELGSVYAIEYDTRTTRRMPGVAQPVMSLTGKRYFAEGLGVRTETYQNGVLIALEIYNRKENTWLWISYPTRKYNLVNFEEGEERQGGWHLTPEHWIEGFAVLPQSEHVEQLDVKVIGGRRVRGFETRAALPETFGDVERTDRYWIDDQALTPARCEHIVPMPNGMGEMELVEENFRYNPRLDAELFAIEVPEGYQPLAEDAGSAKDTAD